MIIKRNYILYILCFFVFIHYSSLDEYIRTLQSNNITITNYIITPLVISFIIFFKRIPFNRYIVKVVFLLFCIFLINFILAPFKNPSWFFYQTLFLLTSFYIASIYGNITSYNFDNFKKNIDKIFIIGLFFLSVISFYILFNYYGTLIEIFKSQGRFNSYIAHFYHDFYWDKLSLNAFIAIILCYILALENKKTIHLILLLPSLFLVPGMRSFMVGLFCMLLLIKIRNMKLILLFLVILLFSVYIYTDYFFEILKTDIRINSYANTLYIISHYPFGVGNGYYHTFVNDILPIDFYYSTGVKGMPVATESDLVYIFGSFGLVFGLMLYSILLSLIFKICIQYQTMNQIDKCFSLMFIFFVFAGIGEDYMFGYPFWIIFGFSLGVVSSKRIIHNSIKKQAHLILSENLQ